MNSLPSFGAKAMPDASDFDVFSAFSKAYAREKQETLSLRDFLLAARDDKMMVASPAERMIAAIGEPEFVDTSKDARLGRIFSNRTIKRYKAFEGFYGMEDTIERIVGYFKHAAQGLEEKRQVLYLLGPVGGGKSSLAERLKELMEVHPIYALKAGSEISPVFESPLGLFRSPELQGLLERVHQRGIAYVDLHKRENILVGTDGRPYLIDFQISQYLPQRGPLGAVLRVLQRCDDYHLSKHIHRSRRDSGDQPAQGRGADRPWVIRAHRQIAVPFRTFRRQLLVWLKVRAPGGRAQSEAEPEVGAMDWHGP